MALLACCAQQADAPTQAVTVNARRQTRSGKLINMERCGDSLHWLKIQTERKLFKRHVKRPEFEEQRLGSFLPFSASTPWQMVRAGTFPAPLKLGPAITAWREQEVVDWLNQQSAGGQS